MADASPKTIALILRAASATFIIRVIATGIAYVTVVALARWMGPAEYGAYAYASAWAFLLALPAGLGVPIALVRFIPEYLSQQNLAKVSGMLRHSISVTFLTSVVLGALGILLVVVLGARVSAAYRVPLFIALAGLPMVTFLSLGSQIGRAFGWVAVGYSVPQIWHPLAFFLANAVLMLAGFTLTAPIVVALWAGLGILAIAGQGAIYLKRLAPGVRTSIPEFDRSLWLRVSIPLLVIDAFQAVISYTDVLMIGAYRNPESVGFYFAAARIATLVTFFFHSVSALAGPKLAELNVQGKTGEMQSLLRSIAPWIALPAAAMTILIIILGPFLLRIFGAGFEVAWYALVFLSVGNLVTSITGPAGLLLNMTGHQDTVAKVYASSAIANGILNFVLVPRYGITGAAAATAISTGAISSLLFVFVRTRLGISTSIVGRLAGSR